MAVITKTLKASGGDYSLMSTGEATEASDLVTATNQHVLECDAFTCNDSAGVVISSGWTTSSTYNITIKAAAGAEHDGVVGAGFILNATGAATAFSNGPNDRHVTIQDIELVYSGSTAARRPVDGGSNIKVHRCILRHTGSVAAASLQIASGDGQEYFNCLIIKNTSGSNAVYWDRRNDVLFYNNTVVGVFTCDSTDSNAAYFYNNAFLGDVLSIGTSWDGASHNAFSGTGSFGTSTQTVSTTDGVDLVSPSTDDYKPTSGGVLRNGTDLSGTFTTDITGATRSGWDIGAYGYFAAGGTGGIRNPLGGPLTLRSPLGI
jgi:hypothetical protein